MSLLNLASSGMTAGPDTPETAGLESSTLTMVASQLDEQVTSSSINTRISPCDLLARRFLISTKLPFSRSINTSKSLKLCWSKLLRQRLRVSSRSNVGIQTDAL